MLDDIRFSLDSPPPPSAPAVLAQWAERGVAVDILNAVPPRLRDALEPFVEREPGVIAYGASGVDSWLLNRVFIGGENAQVSAGAIEAVLGRVRRRGVTPFVHLAPDAQRPEVLDALAAGGIARYRRAWIKLARRPGALPAHRCELELREARPDDADTFAELSVSCLGLARDMRPLIAALVGRPRWHVYTACDGEQIVATAALMVIGDVGYLGFGATRPDARGRGAQQALIDKRLRVAFALGCRWVFSETGEAIEGEPNASYRNLVRAGFRAVQRRENFARVGEMWR